MIKNCEDCGKEYDEPLLVCPECFDKILATDDPRIKRRWFLEPLEGETVSDYAERISREFVYVGEVACGRVGLRGQPCGYIGDQGVNRGRTEEEIERNLKYIRLSVSSLVCSAINRWVAGHK